MSEAGHTERLEAALDGKYRIERKLGEGGMASVYLAEDIKHKRNVALKILRPELAAVIGAERFLAEIQTTANLQHPHVLPLFDSGEAGGYLYYVMPYIDGETLREKLDREKQLGVEEAVRVARDVADALDYAHRAGVIHRDIKPGNILLHDGRPVVADFGIALAVSAAGGGRMTETGLSLGTPHYMSPEQASADRDLSPKSDVYSLGCVLYEMLAGQPPHTGPSAQSILVHILTKDVTPLTELRHTVPPNVAATVAKAIEKLPADRFESAKDFMAALGDTAFSYRARPRDPTASQVAAPAAWVSARSWHRDPRSLVAAAAIALAAWGWLRPSPVSQPDAPTRMPIPLGEITVAGDEDILVSPDGSRFAVAGTEGDQSGLYWRNAAEETFRLVPGTEGARGAAFSPDGQWIVYDDGAALMKVSLAGGAPTPVVPAGVVQDPEEPYWGDDGTIVFIGEDGLYRVPDTGGQPELLHGEGRRFRHPSLLPGGRAVIGAGRGSGVMLLDLATDSVRQLVPVGLDPQYVETGHILYADGAGGLWALPFDPERLEVLGSAVPVFDELTVVRGLHARYSISRNGTLVYGAGGGAGAYGRTLLVVDLNDGEVEEPNLDPRGFFLLRWSPDGQTVAYGTLLEAGGNIFTYNVALGTTPRQLTFEGGNVSPVWSPDGNRVAFASTREGTDGADLFVKNVNDNSPPELILTRPGGQLPWDWPSDDVLIFEDGDPADLWIVDPSSDSAVAREYLASESALERMRVSPSGDLAAYHSNESGRREVYVRSFPEAGAPELVSRDGGWYPHWSPDGTRIYYWSATQAGGVVQLTEARVDMGPPFVVTGTEVVLEGRYEAINSDLHPDGDRIVITGDGSSASADQEGSDPERFLVVVNWFEELRERLGEN